MTAKRPTRTQQKRIPRDSQPAAVWCVDCLLMDDPPKTRRPIYDGKSCCINSELILFERGPGKWVVTCANCNHTFRTPRCYSHYLAVKRQRKEGAKDARRARIYGLSKLDFENLKDWQGGRCPCGRNIKAHDHDHKIARAQCPHPEDQACKRCMRGLLCTLCNSDILGKGYTAQMLRNLADYVESPPAFSLWIFDDIPLEEAS